jgi:8-oxo-dGTP pyrophosphatase MutT (NUDIX family)
MDDGDPEGRAPRRGTGGTVTDPLWRAAYRLGFPVMRLWWRLRRPAHDGAVVAVWHAGRVLAVRQSYRRNPSFPGGGLRRGEDPREAARRELAEELGLAVAAEDLVPAREIVVEWDFRRDHVRVFELRLDAAPAIRLDNREIVAARFVAPEALLRREDLPPFVRAYLEDLAS